MLSKSPNQPPSSAGGAEVVNLARQRREKLKIAHPTSFVATCDSYLRAAPRAAAAGSALVRGLFINMTYPELDTAVVEAAREKRAKLYASAEQTKINIKNLEAALQTCNEEHARQIALDAAGEDVPAEAAADLANATRRHEESLLRQREILALQTSSIQAAEKDFRLAPGEAHRARVIFAIRELHDAGHAIAAARSALREAELRDPTARKVILEAFNAGFPPRRHCGRDRIRYG
jgi:hypothetical protein